MGPIGGDFFLLRTPLLSIEKLMKFYEATSSADNNQFSIQLKEFYQDPLIQEAIYLATPVVYKQLLKYLRGEITEKKEISKLEDTLLKYLIRLCFRCTPFALFATCTVGTFGESENPDSILLSGLDKIKRVVRLDMDFLHLVCLELLKNENVKTHLKFYSNSSLYEVGNTYRYAKYSFEGSIRSYKLTKADKDSNLQAILKLTKDGITYGDLIMHLCEQGHDKEEATGYINLLIESQLLISELVPVLTGSDALDEILALLTDRKVNDIGLYKELNEISLMLKMVPDSGYEAQKIYRSILDKIKPLNIPFDEAKLFQVDTYRPAIKCDINSDKLLSKIKSTVDVLSKLGTSNLRDSKLEQFKRAFQERYEFQAVPLVQVIDNETGIGYRSAYSNSDLHLKNGTRPSSTTRVSEYKFKKYSHAIQNNLRAITITDEELKLFPEKDSNPSSAFAAVLTIFKQPGSDDNVDFQVSSVGGSSGINLMSRFSHLTEDLESRITDHIHKDDARDPERIRAEVIHLPQARVGNVLSRPAFRDFEIVYLGKGNSRVSISVSDLYLKIVQGHLVLYSKKLKKEIIPRISNAHNFRSLSTLPIYNFLGDMQYQASHQGFWWDWEMMTMSDFLPRVTYKQIILAPAIWNIRKTDIRGKKDADQKSLVVLKEYLKLKNVDRYVSLVEGDNELLLDLDNTRCLALLDKVLSKKGSIRLQEEVYVQMKSPVYSDNLPYMNEIVAALTNDSAKIAKATIKFIDRKPSVKRQFYIGSEWVYYKIYTGKKIADEIIVTVLPKIVKDLKKEKVIDKWFFIRYADPREHIRLRFHLASGQGIDSIVKVLSLRLHPYLQSEQIWSLQLDVYKREMERYGMTTMDLSEDMFHKNSEFVIRSLKLIEENDGSLFKILCVMKVIDIFCRHYYNTPQKLFEYYTLCHKSFKGEFNLNSIPKLKEQLKKGYREKANLIQAFLEENTQNTASIPWLAEFNRHCADYNKQMVSATAQFFKTGKSGKPETDSFVNSHMHMFVNRFFEKDQRMLEFTAYDFLRNYYSSKLARNKLSD